MPVAERGDEVDAFDADVLIYAASPAHPLGSLVRTLFDSSDPSHVAGVGSVLLVPEVLTKPVREGVGDEAAALAAILGRLDLIPVDAAIANLATVFGARYALRAVDAVHLATAVGLGADRFITNNRNDFPRSIAEIDVVYPDDLV